MNWAEVKVKVTGLRNAEEIIRALCTGVMTEENVKEIGKDVDVEITFYKASYSVQKKRNEAFTQEVQHIEQKDNAEERSDEVQHVEQKDNAEEKLDQTQPVEQEEKTEEKVEEVQPVEQEEKAEEKVEEIQPVEQEDNAEEKAEEVQPVEQEDNTEERSEEIHPVEQEEKIEEKVEEVQPVKQEKSKSKVKESKILLENIPEVMEIFNNSKTLHELCNKLADYIGICDKKRDLLVAVVKTAYIYGTTNINRIKIVLLGKDMNLTSDDIDIFNKIIYQKFLDLGYFMDLRPFLSLVSKEIKKHDNLEENWNVEATTGIVTKSPKQEIVTQEKRDLADKPNVIQVTEKSNIMKSMPKIPEFEEVLSKIDYTKSIEERVLYVLNAMGLQELVDWKRRYILRLSNAVVKVKLLTEDSVMKVSLIPFNKNLEAKMAYAEFINDKFLAHHIVLDSKNRVKLEAFWKDFRKVILTDEETEKL